MATWRPEVGDDVKVPKLHVGVARVSRVLADESKVTVPMGNFGTAVIKVGDVVPVVKPPEIQSSDDSESRVGYLSND